LEADCVRDEALAQLELRFDNRQVMGGETVFDVIQMQLESPPFI